MTYIELISKDWRWRCGPYTYFGGIVSFGTFTAEPGRPSMRCVKSEVIVLSDIDSIALEAMENFVRMGRETYVCNMA